jgi:hypothetical protein
MVERRQAPEARRAERLDSPARAAREQWWAGRLAALYGFPVQHCPHQSPGAPRRRWLAGFASGVRTVAAGAPGR